MAARYKLSGGSCSANRWLKSNSICGYFPDFIEEQLVESNCPLTKALVTTFEMYGKHLQEREPILFNMNRFDELLNLTGKKAVYKTHVQIIESLRTSVRKQNNNVCSNDSVLPYDTKVIPFGAKTGRDSLQGSTLNNLPKKYWQYFLAPPKGFCYVLLDYEQQEPAIIAVKAKAENILKQYKDCDLYEAINSEVTGGKLKRNRFKTLFVQYLYGRRAKAIAGDMQLDESLVLVWVLRLKKYIAPIDDWLDMTLYKSKRKGEVKSLDWRMLVTDDCKPLSLRNWPVQAAGADIMRRACFNLDKVGIPLLLTNHDSFLIRLDNKNYDHQLALAQTALGDASAEVLDGFRLKVKVDLVIPSTNLENENE